MDRHLAKTRKPGTLGQYLIAFRLLLDHVGLEPNAARDPRVKLPKQVREEANPPSAEHTEAIIEALGAKWKLLFVTIEQGALRLGEAVGLRWADVDAAGLRLRLPKSATKTNNSRWVYLPQWLMDAIEDTCPLEDRVPDRKVFQGITEASAYQAMTRACRNAKVPALPPARSSASTDHDLASVGCPGSGTRRACRSRAAVDVPRRVQPRHAGRGGRCRPRASDYGTLTRDAFAEVRRRTSETPARAPSTVNAMSVTRIQSKPLWLAGFPMITSVRRRPAPKPTMAPTMPPSTVISGSEYSRVPKMSSR